ncbi:GABA transporter 1-like isoform X2 [Aristolochia californica]|uniref:GABA transporter 1-like isoform X2 n=1 Tax=Aristolochia californica TaxID=171875 RepID=UPI0035DFCB74
MGTLSPVADDLKLEEAGLEPSPFVAQTKLDAGALFVLKSKGSWVHCGYHLTTSIVAPALLSLPFAFASLGWALGLACLSIGAIISFYSYNLLSAVIEHHAKLGRRHLRFRDMARDILGPNWGRFYVGPIQFAVCFGAVVGNALLGGQSMKFIYLLARPNGGMKLYEFVAIFGILYLVLAQLPSFHSLRHVNLISLVLSLAYSACAAAGSIYVGNSSKAPPRDYSVNGDLTDRLFGVFNAISIIATTYGNGIIPEIQATLAPPVTGKMFKGLCICYAVVVATFFSVSVSGYWAFGNQAAGTLTSNFMVDGKPLVPKWFLLMTNVFTLLQASTVGVVIEERISLLTTNKRGARREICQPKERSILRPQCHPKIGLPLAVSHHRDHDRCNATVLWRHKRHYRSIRVLTSRLCVTSDLLQCDLSAIETAPSLLGQYCHFPSFCRACSDRSRCSG